MKYAKLIPALVTLSLLQGCAVVVAGAAATGVSSAEDRRTLGSQIDDNAIELKAQLALQQAKGITASARIVVKSVNGNLLLVGQSPNQYLRELAVKILAKIDGVKRVHNQVKIGHTTSMSTQTMDTWLTTRVKLKLLTEKDIRSNHISVLTENTEVYLMGLVSTDEANKAVEVARNIPGVTKVIKVFEVL